MLQEVFAQEVRDQQSTDECKCRDFLIAAGNLGELALEVSGVGVEVVTLPYLDYEKVMVVSLSLPRDAYWIRNDSATSLKLQRECGGKE